jgi:hypothetical protein
VLVRKLKAGDRLYIGDGVFIDCLKAGTGSLRIAISAPVDVALSIVAGPAEEDPYPANQMPNLYERG